MSKIAVIYWSGTGNTEAMAKAVAQGARGKGASAELLTPDAVSPSMLSAFTGVALGCPAMGAETLEEDEFEPMFQSIKSTLAGKKVALFGSYGWGGGEWMTNWEAQCKGKGVSLAADSVICENAPDGDALDKCKALGAKLAG